MPRARLLAVAAFALAAVAVAVADAPKKEEKPARPTTKEEFAALAKDGPKPPWLLFPGQTRVQDEIKYGTVVAVSADAIEIRPSGKKEGTVKYPPHALLATGAVCHWVSDAHCYLLDDVRKGDVVILGVGTVDQDKGAECFYVRIHERPGGAVPPSRKPSDTKPYHLEREYELYYKRQGLETPEEVKTAAEKRRFLAEKGIPIPPEEPKKDDPKKKD